MDKRDFFDLWAPIYDALLPSVFYQAVHIRLLEFVTLPLHAHVLDIGCGTGKLLNRVVQHWPMVTGTGLDFSPAMVTQARQRTPYADRLQFVEGNVTDAQFAFQTFDAVFCCISFLHYPEPLAALQAIAPVLKPSGHFYLVDFTPPPWSGQDIAHRGISPAGVTFYSAAARTTLGAQAGLRCDRHAYLLGPVMMTQFSPQLL
ncbi:MAG: class I SAM-dependent methyltransferase [Leptolyngbya sp. SIOISBB]|nr:class I SAM-dependent methyltransferase [Leptolyngbya sp. SIOISBB]